MKTALILYPHQLFPFEQLPAADTILMVEEPLYFGVDAELPRRLHKQTLIFRRASMRRYAEEVLWPHKVDVEYIELDVFLKANDILNRLKKYDRIVAIDPVDHILTQRMLAARRARPDIPAIEFVASPNFYLADQEARQYFAAKQLPSFAAFYQWQRERFNVLIGENYKPEGGSWILPTATREKLPATTPAPSFQAFGDNKWVAEASKYVAEHFAANPGHTDFVWPTNHAEARSWLDDFIANRLAKFSTYLDAINPGAAWGYHSVLSVSLNSGLLSPHEVVEAALQAHAKSTLPLDSLEEFIRRVIGVREYARGMYVAHGELLTTANPLGQHRRLTPAWYNGTTGIPPFDDLVQKLLARGYAHQTEIRLVAANLMTLCEIDPGDIRRWLGELTTATPDWYVQSNVFAFATMSAQSDPFVRPCIASSNQILQLSDYQRGEWSDIWDGLFWRFVEQHKDTLKHSPSLRVLVHRLAQLDPDRRRIIHYRAEDFLTRSTSA